MKRTTLAIYERKCSFDDCSEERKEQSGNEDFCMITYRYNPKTGKKEEIPTEELFSDLYTVTTTNAAGQEVPHSFKTKEEANVAFIRLKSEFKGWVKL